MFFLYLPLVIVYYIIDISCAKEAAAQQDVYLAVRAGGSGLMAFGLDGFVADDPSGPVSVIKTTLDSDLNYSGIFRTVTMDESSGALPGDILGRWRAVGAKYYLVGDPASNGKSIGINVLDLTSTLSIFKEEYVIDPKRPWYTAHVIVDDLIEHFTGLRGGFASKITFVRGTKGANELYLMDADGRNVQQITFSKSLIMSPSWSADGKSIAYSSLQGGNWRIIMTNISTGQSVDITQWPVLNTTPAFHPKDPTLIAFASSRDGNTEIYTCRTNGKDIRRLTNNRRIDHAPAWSPDGSQMAFVSDRTGNPLIYIMNSDGSGEHRLTATPNAYEDGPQWSPQGDRIVFVMMSDYGFDIATSSPSGDDVIVLTFAQGSNEDPKWSPDGLRILFTSTRGTGIKRLFVMNRDGSNVRPLTIDGESFSPAWAPAVSADGFRK